eukprot:Hpha_TRINITY_DN16602_c1_g3::TRINITY_DN16602_c1_g3_i1::g.181141::m.181141/K14548/UTP4, CIRH1A; U3 small nucleolar RNA-associated protein 4
MAGSVDTTKISFAALPPAGITCISPSPDGKRVAVIRDNNAVELYSVAELHPFRLSSTPPLFATHFRSAAWLDSRHLAVATLGGQLVVYKYGGNYFTPPEVTATVSVGGGACWKVAVHPRQEVVAVGVEDGRLRLFANRGKEGESVDLELLHRQYTVSRSKAGRITAAVFSADGALVYVGTREGRVAAVAWEGKGEVWNRSTVDTAVKERIAVHGKKRSAEERRRLKFELEVIWDLAVTPHSVLACNSEGYIKVLDPATGLLLQSVETHLSDVLWLAPIGAGEEVLCSGVDNRLALLKHRVWEQDWVLAERRGWGKADVTAGVVVGEVLLTGARDGRLRATEAEKAMRQNVRRVEQDYTTVLSHAVAQLEDEELIVASKGRKEVVVQRTDRAITFFGVPDTVPLLSFQHSDCAGITAFAVAPDCSRFAFSTPFRTTVFTVTPAPPSEDDSSLPLLTVDGAGALQTAPAAALTFTSRQEVVAAGEDTVRVIGEEEEELPDCPKARWQCASAHERHSIVAV